MKAGFLAVAAAMAAGAVASNRHIAGHAAFHERRHNLATGTAAPSSPAESCGCVTSWVTTYGEMTLHMPPPPAPTTTQQAPPPPALVPTPQVTTCPTPGVYTIPATTVTITAETTVCAATSTPLPPGTHTVGGVTTVVVESTTVVCPVATAETKPNGEVTSYVKTTTYVCPSAGTHTIGAMTTTVTKSETCVYPVPTNYHPGTYCQPEVVATVTETDYVVFCPYTKVEEQQSTTTSAPAAVQPQETQPAEQPTEQPAKRPVEKPSKQNKESGPNVSQLTNNGNQWAITYTPYDSNTGDCKDAGSVLMDITTIKAKGFSTVRIYSTDCGGLTSVGAACEALGLRMILGIFIDKEKGGIDGARPQIKDIVSWAKWEIVDLIVIGNEAVFGNQCSIDELISFIGECKSAFSAAGYSGPCTTTETIDILQEHQAAICEVVDIVGSNIHAFFNGGVLPENAGDFVCNSQLPIAQNLCPGKKAICLESGWPANGPANGASVASPDAQKKAIDSIMGTCGGDTVLFSFKNDKWKQGAWEQNFGCGGLFGGGSKF